MGALQFTLRCALLVDAQAQTVRDQAAVGAGMPSAREMLPLTSFAAYTSVSRDTSRSEFVRAYAALRQATG